MREAFLKLINCFSCNLSPIIYFLCESAWGQQNTRCRHSKYSFEYFFIKIISPSQGRRFCHLFKYQHLSLSSVTEYHRYNCYVLSLLCGHWLCDFVKVFLLYMSFSKRNNITLHYYKNKSFISGGKLIWYWIHVTQWIYSIFIICDHQFFKVAPQICC